MLISRYIVNLYQLGAKPSKVVSKIYMWITDKNRKAYSALAYCEIHCKRFYSYIVVAR